MSQLRNFRIEDNKSLLGAIIKPRESNVPAHLFWDPILSDGVEVKCTLHHSQLTRLGRWTSASGRNTVRQLWHVGRNCLLISGLYLCKKCGHDSLHLAHDGKILQQLPSSVEVPFETFHKSGATKEIIDLIVGGIKNGEYCL